MIFNFTQEAFHNIENAKMAFFYRPSIVGSLVLTLIVLALVVYGINRSRDK